MTGPIPLLDLRRLLGDGGGARGEGGERCGGELRTELETAGGELQTELEAAFGRVLRSGTYILGPEVRAFEEECRAYLGVKHAIGVSSGTDALLMALMALGVGQTPFGSSGVDEVICPTYTFFATAGAIWRVGARPVFVDCDPKSFNIDPAQIASRITARTKAIVVAHLFGQCADMQAIGKLGNQFGIPVVEDAAQGFGASLGGKKAGAWGALGCFSFFPSKNLGGFGDAGLVTTNRDDLAERLRILRIHGACPKYHHAVVGGNFRIDELQAALLRVKLKRIDAYTTERRANAARYVRLFREAGMALTSLPVDDVHASEHTFNQFVIRLRSERLRDGLRAFLKEQGIGTEVYYPVPMHEQACFRSLGYVRGDLPNAEAAARETLALPVFPGLREDEIVVVVERIAAYGRAAPMPEGA